VDRDGAVLCSSERDEGVWTWPPAAPVEAPESSLESDGWAPPTCVRHPWLRIGRWTLLYRRAA
jgi:hypothetical protein